MKFLYEVANNDGETTEGTIVAESERDALRQLNESGQIVVRLSVQDLDLTDNGQRITREDLLLLLQELAALLQARVSLIDSIQSLSDGHHHSGIALALYGIGRSLEKGESFSVALRKAELKLPEYMYQLATAGEMTGKLADSLADGVQQMEYEHEIAAETRNALVYPAVLVTAGTVAIGIVFTFVVPKFTNLLERPDDLPALAYFVLSMGMLINSYGWQILALLLALIVGTVVLFRQPAIKQAMLDQLSHWPLIGSWLVESEAGRWTGLLGTLLGNGVGLIESLELSNRGVQLRGHQAKFNQVVRSVRSGMPLSAALQEQQALTSMSYHILKVGESSGQLPHMLRSVSGLYATSGKNRMRRVLTLIEPLAILLIGGVIGTVILGIMLAITSAADVPL